MRWSQKDYQPEFIEGYQFVCQYFGKLNMTIKLTFEAASFLFFNKLYHHSYRFYLNAAHQ